jgi:catechol-2,3-dioxygenase
MSGPKEIGHIVLNVTDVERSTRFYRDVVGFQVSRYRPDGTGAFLTCGVVHHNLALFKAPAGARPAEKGAIGLAYMKSTRGGAVPMDITAAEPPRAEIPAADFTRVG